MGYATRPLGLGFLALMIIIAFQITTKKGLCMDSSIVYKIDNISSEKTESMYACKMHRKVGFSVFFYEQREQISSRLARVEVLLRRIGAETPLYLQLSPESMDSLEKSVVHGALKLHLHTEDEAFTNLLADFLTRTEPNTESAISSAWWRAYGELSYQQRFQFYNFVVQQLRDRTADAGSFKGFPSFANSFYRRLERFGIADGKFDFIFETENPAFPVEELQALTRRYEGVRVALKNRGGVYVLPFMQKAADSQKIQAEYRFVSGERIKASDFANNTEHLIILKSDSNVKLAPLFDEGARSFLFSNRKLDFVHIHLPSYKLKKQELHKVSDYFEFVRNSKMVSEWVRERNAYKPVAAVDVIQYYRINSSARQ
jgi:hypothetical protein